MVWLIPIGSRDYPTYLRDFADFNEVAFTEVVRQDPPYASVVWLFVHLVVKFRLFIYPLNEQIRRLLAPSLKGINGR